MWLITRLTLLSYMLWNLAADKLHVPKVAVIGTTGYTGSELVRLLYHHRRVRIDVLTSENHVDQDYGSVCPQFTHVADLTVLCNWEDALTRIRGCDLVFCCLPHSTAQDVVHKVLQGCPVKVIDLSADFRLADTGHYKQVQAVRHKYPDLLKTAAYGLTEVNKERIKGARLVANPGCYATAVQLALIPLLRSGQICCDDIIVDAKSGVSGAGRSSAQAHAYCEISGGMHAYAVGGSHRHCPEIEQGLSSAAGRQVVVSFTPHLVPMNRGILASMYVKLADNATVEDLRLTLKAAYTGERFAQVLDSGAVPQTRHVRGSNMCHIAVQPDRIPGRAIVFCAIDNLVKGAAGQAIQNMNLMLGFPEHMGLEQDALFP